MSYAGHVIDMINRMKQNREQIKSRREKVARLYEKMSSGSHQRVNKYVGKKYSAAEIERIKAGIKLKIRHEQKQGLVLSVLLTIFICLLLVFIILSLRGMIPFYSVQI
jgi:hypothetical protein